MIPYLAGQSNIFPIGKDTWKKRSLSPVPAVQELFKRNILLNCKDRSDSDSQSHWYKPGNNAETQGSRLLNAEYSMEHGYERQMKWSDKSGGRGNGDKNGYGQAEYKERRYRRQLGRDIECKVKGIMNKDDRGPDKDGQQNCCWKSAFISYNLKSVREWIHQSDDPVSPSWRERADKYSQYLHGQVVPELKESWKNKNKQTYQTAEFPKQFRLINQLESSGLSGRKDIRQKNQDKDE